MVKQPSIAMPGPVEDMIGLVAFMSPMLLTFGAPALIVASLLALRLRGRRGVMLVIVATAVAAWGIGFLILSEPGLIELP